MNNIHHQHITAFAPASVSNLNCGFDVLGFALDAPGDKVELRANNSGVVRIGGITGDGGLLPREAEKNTASAVIQRYLDQTGIRQGVDVFVHKMMPLNSGLGSSAASSVAALVAINAMMGNLLSREALLPLALEGERLACGHAHADNVAPSLLGGLVLIRSYDPLEVVSLPVPPDLWCVVVHPDVSVPTKTARQMLPVQIPLGTAVRQWGNLAGLVAALFRNDMALLARSMHDGIAEPVRSPLIPHFDDMKQAALQEKAIAFGISGSGPTIFAFADEQHKALLLAKKLSALLDEKGIRNEAYVSRINTKGAYVIGS